MAPRDPYLTRRRNVFYFRRALPAAVVGQLGRRELNLSLRTANPVIARQRCRVAANVFELALARVERMRKLNSGKIDGLVRTYFEREWERMNERVWIISEDPAADAADELEGAREIISQLEVKFGSYSIDNPTRFDAAQLLQAGGYKNVLPASEACEQVARGMMRARIEALRIFAATLQGKTGELAPKDPLFDGIVVTGMPALLDEGQGGDKSLAEKIIQYCDFKSGGDWTERTAKEFRRGLDMFAGFAGPSTPVEKIGPAEIRSFRDLLAKLPKGYRANPKYCDKPITAMPDLAEPGELRISVGTQKKYFGGVRAFFDWLENEAYISASPVHKIGVAGKSQSGDLERWFTDPELQALIKSPQFLGHRSKGRRSTPGKMLIRDEKFWLPLIALFSGMRLAEIAQLRVSDVRKSKDGIPYLDVNKGGGEKSLKTMSSVRLVPIHPTLDELGFGFFVEARRLEGPNAWLFPGMAHSIGGGQIGKGFSKWFARYLLDVGLKREGLTFHSFRHTFIRALRGEKIPDARMRAIVGHADASVTAKYGGGHNVELLADDVSAVKYKIDFLTVPPYAQS